MASDGTLTTTVRTGRAVTRWAIWVPAIAISAFYAMLFASFVIDDAYITFAYSQTFAETGQLRLRIDNLVEANSSFLWSAALGVLSAVVGDPVLWSKLLGVLAQVGCIVIVSTILVGRTTTVWQGFLVATAVAAPFGFGLWANYGMENGLVALLCFAVVAILPGESRRRDLVFVPLLMLGLYMVRPEGFGLVFVLYGAEVARRIWLGRPRRNLMFGLLLFMVLAAGYEAFGLVYYGNWLPNSATAKLDADLVTRIALGLRYSFASSHILVAWVVPVALAIGAVQLFRRQLDLTQRDDASIFLGLTLTAAVTGFVLLSGGDWMPAGRFYAAVLPFAAGYVAVVLLGLPLLNGPIVASGLLALFGLSQLAAAAIWYPRAVDLRDAEERALQGMVDDLNRIARDDDVLALSDIGRAAYGFRGDVFDWWGLGSTLVTERNESIGRITPETVMMADPEFLVIYANTADGPNIEAEPSRMAASSWSLVTDETLMARYCRLATYPFWEERFHVLLVRRDVLENAGLDSTSPSDWTWDHCSPAVRRSGE